MTARIDILLATYNGGRYLSGQLASLEAQTHRDWHLFARDDGSSDDTSAILQAFAHRFPLRVTILPTEARLGARGSFAALMAQAQADYIAFCDQDDIWLPHKLEHLFSAMRNLEGEAGAVPALVHCDLELVDDALSPIAPSFWRYQGIDPARNDLARLLMENTVTGCATLINRALLELALPMPDAAQMHDHWLALIAAATGRIAYVDAALVRYRQHGKNVVGASRPGGMGAALKADSSVRRGLDLRPSCRRAEALVEAIGAHVDPARLAPARALAQLYDEGWLGRRLLLWRHGMWPYRWRRRVLLLCRI
ncbi:glycosyltransferase family 2 protein [Uliginosibacterium sp. sgz301328]|uniref:glycosyltransferase family 2 protein n=1 Tax=Uliginosibacterium sp. sgz301328 TaxID=3243764 RepID=UPI00359DBA02